MHCWRPESNTHPDKHFHITSSLPRHCAGAGRMLLFMAVFRQGFPKKRKQRDFPASQIYSFTAIVNYPENTQNRVKTEISSYRVSVRAFIIRNIIPERFRFYVLAFGTILNFVSGNHASAGRIPVMCFLGTIDICMATGAVCGS